MVNKNRAQAVRDLITQYQPDIIISDDGLQHYAMGRAGCLSTTTNGNITHHHHSYIKMIGGQQTDTI
jgi:tetraacyldisaccharide-1-P 4'-kinase